MLIELVYYRDKSVKEAAALAKIPENTVKSRMFLARKKLAALLAAANIDGCAINFNEAASAGRHCAAVKQPA